MLTSWEAGLRAELQGRRVVRVGPLSSAGSDVELLRGLGADDVLLVGYGIPPGESGCKAIVVERPVGGLLRLTDAVAVDEDIGRRVGLFDPDGAAWVWAPPSPRDSIWHRPTIGLRRERWRALEDKTIIDALWDEAGVARAPSLVVPAEGGSLQRAATELDAGGGTVWSGDPASGVADSASLVFWVNNDEQAQLATQALTAASRRARVMPYLVGVPCSIHALVGGDGQTAVFRPVEIITLRRPDGRFLYAGTHTWWDPPTDIRQAMRETARRLARHLARTRGYRGPFGIDGILTSDGFLPTELNSRWTAGFYPLSMVSPLPLRLVADFVSSGLKGPFDVLEEAVIDAADTRRWGGPTLSHQRTRLLGRLAVSATGTVVEPGHASAHLAVSGELADATVLVRPHGEGLLGQSLGPLAARLFEVSDDRYGTHIGPLISSS